MRPQERSHCKHSLMVNIPNDWQPIVSKQTIKFPLWHGLIVRLGVPRVVLWHPKVVTPLLCVRPVGSSVAYILLSLCATIYIWRGLANWSSLFIVSFVLVGLCLMCGSILQARLLLTDVIENAKYTNYFTIFFLQIVDVVSSYL